MRRFLRSSASLFSAISMRGNLFQAQPPGYRRVMTHRVMSAKREETREKRLDQLIGVSAQGRRINLLKPDW